MNGFLVLLRGTGDDIPIALFADYKQAKIFANSMPWSVDYNTSKFFPEITQFVCIDIVSFHGGKVSDRFTARDYLDEEE